MHDFLGGLLDQAAGRDELGGGKAQLALLVAERGYRHGHGGESRPILRLHLRRHLDNRALLVSGPFDPEHLGAVLGLAHPFGEFGVARPAHVAGALPVGALESRQRNPCLGDADHRLDTCRQREGAPSLGHRIEDCFGRSQAWHEANGTGGKTGLQNVAAIHLGLSPHSCSRRGGAGAPVVGNHQDHPASTRAARDSGLYRKRAELQGGGPGVNSRS